MADIFDHGILCNKCGKKMRKIMVDRSGFKIRTMECPGCGGRIYHPSDMEEFNKYSQLRGQNFQVKLRRVGNSYTVSIPKELIDFFDDFERPEMDMHKRMAEQMEHMSRMVTLALEQSNRLSLSFGKEGKGDYDKTQVINRNGMHGIVREKSETRPLNVPGGKGFVSRKMKVVRMSNNPNQNRSQFTNKNQFTNRNQFPNKNQNRREPRLFEDEEENDGR